MKNLTVKPNQLLFARLKPQAIIPTKRVEDAGRDVYACFDEDFMIIAPHETKLIPTGIASVFSEKYVALLRERGSTGVKGMGQRAGVIDSGFRGEWFVPITNTTDRYIVIEKPNADKDDINRHIVGDLPVMATWTTYPYTKAIAQVLMVEVPVLEQGEITYEELLKYTSERGIGSRGSSNK